MFDRVDAINDDNDSIDDRCMTTMMIIEHITSARCYMLLMIIVEDE